MAVLKVAKNLPPAADSLTTHTPMDTVIIIIILQIELRLLLVCLLSLTFEIIVFCFTLSAPLQLFFTFHSYLLEHLFVLLSLLLFG